MNTLNAVIGGAVSAVGDGGISLAALAGENPERFGKVLRPKSTDHFVAKPPAADGLSSPGFGEQVRSNALSALDRIYILGYLWEG